MSFNDQYVQTEGASCVLLTAMEEVLPLCLYICILALVGCVVDRVLAVSEKYNLLGLVKGK